MLEAEKLALARQKKIAEKKAVIAASSTAAEDAADRSDTTTADQSEHEVIDIQANKRKKKLRKNRNRTSAVWSWYEDAPNSTKAGHSMA